MSDVDFDYQAEMKRLILFVPLLIDSLESIQKCQQTVSTAHALGPILDPTAYNRGMGNLDDAEGVLSALGRCAEELKAIRERIVEREAKRAARVLR